MRRLSTRESSPHDCARADARPEWRGRCILRGGHAIVRWPMEPRLYPAMPDANVTVLAEMAWGGNRGGHCQLNRNVSSTTARHRHSARNRTPIRQPLVAHKTRAPTAHSIAALGLAAAKPAPIEDPVPHASCSLQTRVDHHGLESNPGAKTGFTGRLLLRG